MAKRVCPKCGIILRHKANAEAGRMLGRHMKTAHPEKILTPAEKIWAPGRAVSKPSSVIHMSVDIPTDGVKIRLITNHTIGTVHCTPTGLSFVKAKGKKQGTMIKYDTLLRLLESGFIKE